MLITMEPNSSSDQRPVIQASEILAKIERGEDVEYDGVIVEGDLDISGLELPTEHVERTKWEVEVLGLIEDAKIVKSPITITNCQIMEPMNFGNAVFQRQVEFKGTIFNSNAYFGGAQFRSDIDFCELEFDGEADFSAVDFDNDAYFCESEFNGETSFDVARFENYVDFKMVKFNDFALFSLTEFEKYADFREIRFRGDVDFWQTQFYGDANFGGIKFYGDGYFGLVQFNGSAKFDYTQFTSNAYFKDAKFCGDANFESAKFSDNRNSETNFQNTLFCKNTSFIETQFSPRTDFRAAQFDNSLDLTHARFDCLEVEWNTIKHMDCDETVYIAFVRNFRDLAQFSDADDCYYQYRKKSQARKKWHEENGFNWSKLLDWIGFVSCGYGVKLGPIILWVLGSVLSFTLLYKLLPQSYGGIAESGPSTVTMEAVNNSTLLFIFSSGDGAVSPSWGECLYFSFTALTGGIPDELHPVGLCKYAVMIEGVLGYLFLALFVVVLARKIIR
jgi:uncharacterized protein YjbI with pentapeptide repeats